MTERESFIASNIIALISEEIDHKYPVTLNSNIRKLGIDSLDIMSVLMNLEDIFDIEIPETMSNKLTTVGDIINTVVKLTKDDT